MSMRTPLGKVRGLGSAKQGTEHFWLQRVTAVALVPLAIFFVFLVVTLTSAPFEVALARVGSPVIAVLLLATILAGVVHMRLGMQVIIEDYVHGEGAKVLLLMTNTFFAFLIGIGSVLAVAKIFFVH
jgi:succinate dehydrogenase / fumarate reductase, membrane anchor subunit